MEDALVRSVAVRAARVQCASCPVLFPERVVLLFFSVGHSVPDFLYAPGSVCIAHTQGFAHSLSSTLAAK